jgi:hypothetical protein
MQKRSVEALSVLLETCLKEIICLKKNHFFLKVEGLKVNVLKALYKSFIIFLKKNINTVLIGFKHVQKITHNGCRRKK